MKSKIGSYCEQKQIENTEISSKYQTAIYALREKGIEYLSLGFHRTN